MLFFFCIFAKLLIPIYNSNWQFESRKSAYLKWAWRITLAGCPVALSVFLAPECHFS